MYTFTTIDVPGGINARALGINDAGQIVGDFRDATGAVHGFLKDGATFTTRQRIITGVGRFPLAFSAIKNRRAPILAAAAFQAACWSYNCVLLIRNSAMSPEFFGSRIFPT